MAHVVDQEVQREEQNPDINIKIALHKPKWNVRQSERYSFGDTMSYTLVVANGDPQTYEEVVASQERERWVQAMIEEMQSLHKNQT